MLTEAESRKKFSQRIACQRGEHCWSQWGNFVPVIPRLTPASFTRDVPPNRPEPVLAFRYRYCECGATESEKWGDCSRTIHTSRPEPHT